MSKFLQVFLSDCIQLQQLSPMKQDSLYVAWEGWGKKSLQSTRSELLLSWIMVAWQLESTV